jgi:hypothetical protein
MKTLTLFFLSSFFLFGKTSFGFDQTKIPQPKNTLNSPYILKEVIDARDFDYIGFWSEFNHNKPIEFPKNTLNKTFKNLFGLENLNQSGVELPITIRINYLNFYTEHSKNGTNGIVGMNVSFLKKENGQYVELFQAAEHLTYKASAIEDVYNQISNVASQCITSFNNHEALNLLCSKHISSDNILNVTYLQPDTHNLQNGLYLDYYSFRENRPDTNHSAIYQRKYNDFTRDHYSVLKPEHGMKPEAYYGFFDGEFIPYRIANQFMPLYSENDSLRLNFKSLAFSTPENILLATTSVLFGFVGGIITYNLIEDNKEYNEPVQTKYEPKMVLDYRTGAFIPENLKGYIFGTKRFYKELIIYANTKTDSDQAVHISCSAIDDITIQKSEYTIIKFPISNEIIKVELSSNKDKTSFEIHPKTVDKKIVALFANEKKGLVVDHLSVDQHAIVEERIDQGVYFLVRN